MSLDKERVVSALPNYEVGEELGRGGWAVVLHARHRILEREVAVKHLPVAFGADPFALCNEVSTGTLDPGDSYNSCTLILVPKGRKPDRVRFVSQGPDNKITFTDWAAG